MGEKPTTASEMGSTGAGLQTSGKLSRGWPRLDILLIDELGVSTLRSAFRTDESLQL
jgi:hypothetical protein